MLERNCSTTQVSVGWTNFPLSLCDVQAHKPARAKYPLPVGTGPLSSKMLFWTTRVSLLNGISFEFQRL